MPTTTRDCGQLLKVIDTLSDNSLEKLASYAAFLRHEEQLEEQEDAADLAVVEARKNEDTIPLSEVIAKHEAKYGSLDSL